jgi:Uma2 family endonuclease
MSHALKYDFIPFDDYLAKERDAKVRSEYVNGFIYAMAGASETHNTIASSLNALIETNIQYEYSYPYCILGFTRTIPNK